MPKQTSKIISITVTITLSIAILVSLMVALMSGAEEFVTKIMGTDTIHPAIIIFAAGLVLTSIIILIIVFYSARSQTASQDGPTVTNIATAIKEQMDDSSSNPIPPEMQFALNAAFEKLKKNRDELEELVAKRTKELRESMETSEDIVASIPSALMIYEYLSPQRIILKTVNSEAIKLSDSKDIIGEDFNIAMPFDLGDQMRDNCIEVMNTGAAFFTQKINYGESDISQAFKIRAFKISDERLGISFDDITDLISSEEKLNKEFERTLLYLDKIGTVVIALEPSGKVSMINDYGCRILGYERDEIIGKKWDIFLAPNDGQSKNKFSKIISGKSHSKANCEMLVVTQSGQEKVLDWNHTLLTDALGHITGIVCSGNDITERVRNETELRKSESQYRRLVMNATEGICIVQKGVVVFANPEMEVLTGYSSDELKNMPIYDIVHPDDLEWIKENNKKHHAGEDVSAVYTMRFVDKENKAHWVEVRGGLITWKGQTAGLNFIIDISERKKAENALRESEEHYRVITENLKDMVVRISLDGTLLYISPAIKYFGDYNPEEEIGQNIGKYFENKNELKRALRLIRLIVKYPKAANFEFLYKPKTGDPFYVEVTTTPIVEGGQVTSVQCVLRDITERKQAEEILKESEERFRSILESAPNIAVQGYNRDRKIIFWNTASEILYGYTREEVMSKQLKDLMTYDSYMAEIDDNQIAIQYGPGEHGMRHKDGSIIPVYSSHVMLRNSRGEDEMYCLDVDLTDLRWAQIQQQVLQDKLERAERMESLGVLAGGVAHDLNNMLGPMVGYSDLILAKLEEDSPYRKQIERIGKSAQDAADVIQDLLTLARRGRYEIKPIKLNDVVNEYLDSPSYQHLSTTRPEINVETNLDSNQPRMHGSPPHLIKVIMNLVVNAYDAMNNNRTLYIGTEVLHLDSLLGGYDNIESRDYIILRIRDTGSGIPLEDQSKIFEPYYSKKKMGTSGSGLGLAVVYGIVKDHKGYYDIFSTVGEGSEFVLYFPVCKSTDTENRTEAKDYSGTESVFVVDDSEEQRQIAYDLLTNLGYDVSMAKHGHEAVEFLKDNSVDIVLMDMIMEKDYDGLDTYRDILKIHPAQKAIIISGFSATDRVNEMQRLGAGEYVRKPFSMDSLGSAVRNELDRNKVTISAL
ncbi:MAG: PAS domain S-box protein [candidate division Zixibacteria bacterium]